MLHAAPLADPKDVAWFLASYARDARARMADADLPALNTVRKALEEALGITFEGIQVGTAITLLLRRPEHQGPAMARFRHLWGQAKRTDLLASLERFGPKLYQVVKPALPLGLPFRPMETDQGYLAWPLLSELFPVWFVGVKTSRDEVVVDIDQDRLVDRMMKYFDPKTSDNEMKLIAPRAMTDAARFEAIPTRQLLVKRGFLAENVLPFAYRPFDLRWLYRARLRLAELPYDKQVATA